MRGDVSATLLATVRDELGALGAEAAKAPLLVAFSGGLDSTVLLHLLRFAPEPRHRLVAAHFDHRMREGSALDASWVRGVCLAWDVPLVGGEAEEVPTSEDEARQARYGFLHSVQQKHDASWLLTAHHADDQAETVLFRVLRGTGMAGLAGIPRTREPGIARPLLSVYREELEAYAERVGLRWRDDPTNEHLGYARNFIRRELLPEIEDSLSPGARPALVRLGDYARENEEAWAEVLPEILERLDVNRAAGTISLARDTLLELAPALRGRVLRGVMKEAGLQGSDAVRRAVTGLSKRLESGSGIDLGSGWVLRRDLDRLSIVRTGEPTAPTVPLILPGPGSGSGELVAGGHSVSVSWRVTDPDAPEPPGDADYTQSFVLSDLAFPLVVRGREPGDRIRTRAGTKKLKKLLLEARIPSMERERIPILAEQGGRVLWVPGVARTTEVGSDNGETMQIRIGE